MLQEKKLEFKEKWSTLSDKDKEPYEKKKCDHLARQGVMQECITDALQKNNGRQLRAFIRESGKGEELMIRWRIWILTPFLCLLCISLLGNGGLVQ